MNTELEQGTITDVSVTNDLHEWITAFLADRMAQNMSAGTIGFYRKKLTKFMVFSHAQMVEYIEDITANHMRFFMVYLQQAGHNPGGQHSFYRSLRAFMRWYEAETDNKTPIAKVKAPRVDVEPLEPVATEDIHKLLEACKGSRNSLRDKAVVLSLVDTGARAGEFLRIDRSDYEDGVILLRQTKNRRPRYVFCGKHSQKAIAEYLDSRVDECPALWITDDCERLKYAGLRMLIRRLGERSGTGVTSIHAFRRTFALQSLKNGVDAFTLRRLGGWSDMQVVTRYVNQSEADLRQAFSSPADKLLEKTP